MPHVWLLLSYHNRRIISNFILLVFTSLASTPLKSEKFDGSQIKTTCSYKPWTIHFQFGTWPVGVSRIVSTASEAATFFSLEKCSRRKTFSSKCDLCQNNHFLRSLYIFLKVRKELLINRIKLNIFKKFSEAPVQAIILNVKQLSFTLYSIFKNRLEQTEGHSVYVFTIFPNTFWFWPF